MSSKTELEFWFAESIDAAPSSSLWGQCGCDGGSGGPRLGSGLLVGRVEGGERRHWRTEGKRSFPHLGGKDESAEELREFAEGHRGLVVEFGARDLSVPWADWFVTTVRWPNARSVVWTMGYIVSNTNGGLIRFFPPFLDKAGYAFLVPRREDRSGIEIARAAALVCPILRSLDESQNTPDCVC